ncbi:MAG: hypothetical protein R3F18_11520 [Lysobacterales bacterium]
MHLLIAIVLVAVVVMILMSRQSAARSSESQGSPVAGISRPRHPLAFISMGKMFLHEPDRDPREIQSPHVQTMVDRVERSRQLHGWKQDTAFANSFANRRSQTGSDDDLPLRATALRFLAPGKVLYFLRDERVGGLFEYALDSGQERRLVHRQNLYFEDLSPSVDGTRVLCAQHASNGSANICLMNADGSGFRELTGGDTVDSAPAWVPDEPGQVLYQTSGLARGSHGHVIARGPASIHLLDAEKGSVTSVLEDPKFDFLQPRVSPDGQLLYLRRPYSVPQYGPSNIVVDTLMFPFRLLRALFHYLNFFSLMYTRKPLTSASGPMVEADLKEIVLKGMRVDAEAALRKGDSVHGVRSLVPKSWQLIRRDRRGQEKLLATHVSGFDMAADGTVYYSNGNGVFQIEADGVSRVVLRDKLIAEIVVGPVR